MTKWKIIIDGPKYRLGDTVTVIGTERTGIIKSFGNAVEVGQTLHNEISRYGEWRYRIEFAGQRLETFVESDIMLVDSQINAFKAYIRNRADRQGYDDVGLANEVSLFADELNQQLNDISHHPELVIELAEVLGLDRFEALEKAGFSLKDFKYG